MLPLAALGLRRRGSGRSSGGGGGGGAILLDFHGVRIRLRGQGSWPGAATADAATVVVVAIDVVAAAAVDIVVVEAGTAAVDGRHRETEVFAAVGKLEALGDEHLVLEAEEVPQQWLPFQSKI